EDARLPTTARSALAGSPDASPIFVETRSAQTSVGYLLLRDLTGRPALVLAAERPRAISLRGWMATTYALGAVALAGAVLVGVILLLVERLVLAPLARLSGEVQRIAVSGDLSTRVAADGRGELATLGAAINGMLQALEVSQRQRREAEAELAGADRQR